MFQLRVVLRTRAGRAARKLLFTVCIRADYRTEVVEPWRAMSVRKREELFLEAMVAMQLDEAMRNMETKDMDTGTINLSRTTAPEITLKAITENDGDGLLQLINQLLPDPTRPDDFPNVRHAGFEDRFDIDFESDSVVPQSTSVRAFQDYEVCERSLFM